MKNNFSNIRRNYGSLSFNLQDAHNDPIEQFKLWFLERINVKETSQDPTAMVLSTADEDGFPDSRIVLLKEIFEEKFIFFTNYKSAKAKQLNHNPKAALNFYWPEFARQVRIRGIVSKISKESSEEYFKTRPLKSQISAIISKQSEVIESMELLEQELQAFLLQHKDEAVIIPKNWGGYALEPLVIEFWQGKDDRLHNRVQYYKDKCIWHKRMLAP